MEYVLDNNQDNTIEIGVTCGYDFKKIESVNFDTGEVVIGEESFNEYKDEINDYLSRRGIDNRFSVSITREGTQEIRGSSGPCDRWVNEDGSWEMGHDLTPDDKEGYVFVPADIQIVRAEGTLHIIQKIEK